MTPKPKTGTGEWAEKNINIQKGCSNGCVYCYAFKMAKRFGRVKDYDAWIHPIITKTQPTKYKHREGVIMMPSSHDICINNIELIKNQLQLLMNVRNHVLLVTKPRLDCITIICDKFNYYKDFIEWRLTIGTIFDDNRKRWEPFAPSISERLECLESLIHRGFTVSISMEPLLNTTPTAIKSIETLLQYHVKEIWIGCMQYTRDSPNIDYQEIYNLFKDNPRIKWKDSFRKHLKGVT